MVNLNDKPQVTIDIDPLVEAYLRFMFKTPPDQEKIIIKRSKIEGVKICSELSVSDMPVKKTQMQNPVTFIIPVTNENHYWVLGHYLYVSAAAQSRLSDFFDAQFHQFLRLKFEHGYKRKYTQTEIVNAIIISLSIRKSVANFDSIKKYDYRNKRTDDINTFNHILEAEYQRF